MALACTTWLVLGVTASFGALDIRNPLFSLPLFCFYAISQGIGLEDIGEAGRSMIRCLILMHSVGGGAEKITLDLARCLDPQRFQVTLGCMRHLSVLAAGVPAGLLFHMPERPQPHGGVHNVARVWRLARDSDVVLGSLELQSIFWAALLAPGRSVAWLH